MDWRRMLPWGRSSSPGSRAGRQVRVLASYHDAAASNRRLKNWAGVDADISTIAAADGDALVRRAHELVLGNPYAANAKEEFAAALVGTGIRPASTIEDEALQTEVMQLWATWCTVAEEQGSISFYGIQDVVAGGLFEAGEMFVRVRPRLPEDGLPVPLQLQLLESEYCDRSYSIALDPQRQIKAGIEVNGINQRLAYWFWRNHPGDRLTAGRFQERVRVPADNVIHVFDVRRASQLRGIPMLAPGMVRLRIFDDYDDAELERKKTAALFAGFITKSTEGGYWSNEIEGTDDEGIPEATARLSPGTFNELLPDEGVEFSEPADVGGNYEAFQLRNLLAISASLGVPYANMTNDVAKANYSSLRAAMLQFRRRTARQQNKIMVHQFCRPVWERFIDAAILSRALKVDPARAPELKAKVLWIPPKWEWVDPLKDRQAERLAMEMKTKARSAVIIEEGQDPEQVDQQIAKDKARAEKLGIQESALLSSRIPDPEDFKDDEQQDDAAPPSSPVAPQKAKKARVA